MLCVMHVLNTQACLAKDAFSSIVICLFDTSGKDDRHGEHRVFDGCSGDCVR